jgi:hypothetical protein
MLAQLFAQVGIAFAQENDFSFRRVKPPEAGVTKRLNIQIEKTWPHETDPPKLDPKADVASDEGAPETPVTDEWFWTGVSDTLQDATPERFIKAIAVLNKNTLETAAITPNAKALDDIMRDHGADILLATLGKRISPAFVLAVISVESAGKIEARSTKGAQGLMQLMPATAERFGVKDVDDPLENIKGGVAYLDWLMGEFKGDPLMVLAGYNAGENAVKSHNGVPPYAETRAYIPKVIAAWSKARMYCQTVPVYADDGCVFALNRSLAR